MLVYGLKGPSFSAWVITKVLTTLTTSKVKWIIRQTVRFDCYCTTVFNKLRLPHKSPEICTGQNRSPTF